MADEPLEILVEASRVARGIETMMHPTQPDPQPSVAGSGQQHCESEYLVYGLVADEVRTSLQEGREPDIEQFVVRHPQLADQIRQLVPALAGLHAI